MTTQLAIFPIDLETLERTGRINSLRSCYPFAGFDRTLCVFLNQHHSDVIERRVDDDFTYLEIGYKRSGAGRLGMAAGAFRAARTLLRAARPWNVDAVIACDPHLLGPVGLYVARRLQVPLAIRLVAHYGLHYETTGKLSFPPLRTRKLEIAFERWMYRKADVVLAACPNHQEYLEEVGGRDLSIMPWVTAQAAVFYETTPMSGAIREEVAPGAQHVVVVNSRLVPSKYPYDIHACAEQLKDVPGLRFVVLGQGPMREELEADAVRRELPVVYAGLRPQEDVRVLFGTADAVIVTQGGGAITEAALCGAPVVTYDFEMNPFVIRPGHEEGMIVPFRDTTELARAVRRFIDDPALARRMGRRAQLASRRRFGIKHSRRAERAIADRLLTGHNDEAFDAWQLDLRVSDDELVAAGTR